MDAYAETLIRDFVRRPQSRSGLEIRAHGSWPRTPKGQTQIEALRCAAQAILTSARASRRLRPFSTRIVVRATEWMKDESEIDMTKGRRTTYGTSFSTGWYGPKDTYSRFGVYLLRDDPD